MSRVSCSVAMTGELDRLARTHLLRPDRQEDVCFGLWYPSRGETRLTALIQRLLLPREGERNVHGNASFEPRYFERALAEAAASGAGLALLHSHPLGRGWQGMSRDDVVAEQSHAAAVFGASNLPFVGLTLAGDGVWSARFWARTAPRTYPGAWCGSVRVIGDALTVYYNDDLAPPPPSTAAQVRTVSAWGEESHANLTRLRVGVVGNGSVGGFIAESIARTGIEDMMLMDFDLVEELNLDRLNFATRDDIGRMKIDALGDFLEQRATAATFRIDRVPFAIYEEEALRKALDCDVLFSCVDRPWGRHVLNFIAYAHLIPVIDGGIRVRKNRLGQLAAADWRAHVAAVGRPCLQCLGQYDAGLVQTEREGNLDDPRYIEGLPDGHPLKARENVFAFSMACASQMMLQMLTMTVSPLDMSNPGAQLFHFVGGFMEKPTYGQCHSECIFPTLTARGNSSGLVVTGKRPLQASSSTVAH